MDTSDANNLLQQYDAQHKVFEQLGTECLHLITRWLTLEKIQFHSVTSRVKDRKNLYEKLTREGKNYKCLADVTDIVGIRVITLFENEIDQIGAIIAGHFTVDWDNSIDKRKTLDPDRFGYLSLHYVCLLSPKHLDLTENEQFRDIKFEIQIRSILQHAWAEIEHDLGYKSGVGLKRPERRRFARIAGLLEIADQEFTAISEELRQYKSQIETVIGNAPASVGIDKISLNAICKQGLVRELDKKLADGIGAGIREENANLLSVLSTGLPFVGITTVEQLLDALKRHKELIVYQAVERYRGKRSQDVTRGGSILQLVLVLMGLKGKEDEIVKGMTAMGQDPDREFAHEVMLKIREFQDQKP